MDVRLLSNKFSVRELNENDIPLIFLLCKENKTYYYFCPPMVDEEKIREDLYVLPPNKTLDDKHFIGYFDEDKLIAIMDLIKKYPNESTCFIGIFMLDISVQNKGIGSTIIKELSSSLKKWNYKYIKLAWIKENKRAENFWLKEGFDVVSSSVDQNNHSVIVGIKEL